jgi:hypothetical protein
LEGDEGNQRRPRPKVTLPSRHVHPMITVSSRFLIPA